MNLYILALLCLIVFEVKAQKIGEHSLTNIAFLKKNPKKMELAKLITGIQLMKIQ